MNVRERSQDLSKVSDLRNKMELSSTEMKKTGEWGGNRYQKVHVGYMKFEKTLNTKWRYQVVIWIYLPGIQG